MSAVRLMRPGSPATFRGQMAEWRQLLSNGLPGATGLGASPGISSRWILPASPKNSGFILADAKVSDGLPEDSIVFSSGPHGAVIIFPMKPGVWRFFGLRVHSDDRSQPTLEEIQRHVDNAGLSHLRLFDPEWLSYFASERTRRLAKSGWVEYSFLEMLAHP